MKPLEFDICLHYASRYQYSKTVGASQAVFPGDRIFFMKARATQRSGCPINLTLEMLGDRWSLIVIRDVMFGNRRHYRELLSLSDEGIASNILADRLKRLVKNGLLSKRDDPTHKQKAIYSLTEPAIQLVPLLAQMGAWGRRHTRVSHELSVRAELLEHGGERMWNAFMAELRSIHLGSPAPRRSVFADLQGAFEQAMRKRVAAAPS
jgi:DNA-binding HxlR family transcriptional regulator